MKSAISTQILLRWGVLVVIALTELTWLAIRVEVPATGPLSVLKGFPSIFITSLAVVTVLVWARFRGRLLQSPIFQDSPRNPWLLALAHVGAFVLFAWLTILVVEGEAISSPFAVFWVLAWAVMGLGAGAYLTAAGQR